MCEREESLDDLVVNSRDASVRERKRETETYDLFLCLCIDVDDWTSKPYVLTRVVYSLLEPRQTTTKPRRFLLSFSLSPLFLPHMVVLSFFPFLAVRVRAHRR